MTRATIAGLAAVGGPLFVLAIILFWRRQKQIVAFAFALLTVALGYLAITGAAADIGRKLPGLQAWIGAGDKDAGQAASQASRLSKAADRQKPAMPGVSPSPATAPGPAGQPK